jgi:para-aminobenzoate synthetase component 1
MKDLEETDSKEKAAKRMHELGAMQKPFLFIIDFAMEHPVIKELPLAGENILFDVNGFTNSISSDEKIVFKEILFSKSPVSFPIYKKAFDEVMKNILQGNSYLVNLTQPSKIFINLTAREIFYACQAKYKLCFHDAFIVFSPETFVRIIENKIYSYPMKGTIDEGLDNADEIILNDEKEKAEHITIVDLIRNDMSLFAKNVSVTKLRYLDYLPTNQKNLLQVSSEITGELPVNFESQIGNIIFSMLPAGSISGAPKKKTVDIIKKAENYFRGYYSGVFGYFDGKNLDSGVMIRYMEKNGDHWIYKSGGGITSMSKAESEYEELINKIYVPVNRKH